MFMPALGNIKRDNIVEIYNTEAANTMRKDIKEDKCPHCWMNCYSVHSIMQHPVKSLAVGIRTYTRRKYSQFGRRRNRVFAG